MTPPAAAHARPRARDAVRTGVWLISALVASCGMAKPPARPANAPTAIAGPPTPAAPGAIDKADAAKASSARTNSADRTKLARGASTDSELAAHTAASTETGRHGDLLAPATLAAAGASPRSQAWSSRRPAGVAVDPQTTLPSAADRTLPDATVASLRPAPGMRQIRDLVGRYFAAIRSEDVAALAAISTDDATFNMPRGKAGAASLVDQWRTRFSHLAYRRSTRNVPYEEDEIAVDSSTDATSHPSVGTLDPAEVLVHVPVHDPRSASGDRLFGDEIWFVLHRRPQGGLAIRQVIEDFQLP